MTDTTTRPERRLERNLAEVIRHRRAGGEMFDLTAQAQRLTQSIRVVEKWMAATDEDIVPPEMASEAEKLHDQLEEELSRVAYEMETLRRRHEYKEVPEEVIDNALLSDTLLEAYCILSAAPAEVFGVGETEGRSRMRYKIMGALLAAQDAANAEVERLET